LRKITSLAGIFCRGSLTIRHLDQGDAENVLALSVLEAEQPGRETGKNRGLRTDGDK